MEIKFQDYLITISPEARTILAQYIQQNSKDPESGGVILGRVVNNNIQIDRLSIPTEIDKSSRTSFVRHRLSAQIVINYEHANSYGQVTYLGEWHTHPEDYPTPSSTDISMIKDQFSRNFIRTIFLILLIQGRKGLSIGMYNSKGEIQESKIVFS